MLVFDGFLFFRIHIGPIGFKTAPSHLDPVIEWIHAITPPAAVVEVGISPKETG